MAAASACSSAIAPAAISIRNSVNLGPCLIQADAQLSDQHVLGRSTAGS